MKTVDEYVVQWRKKIMWCFPKKKKGNDELSEHGQALLKKSTHVSPYNSQRNKMSKVQSIRKEKHNTKYSPEQLHTWANLIQMKKHSCFDDPLPIHFWDIQSVLPKYHFKVGVQSVLRFRWAWPKIKFALVRLLGPFQEASY